MATSNPSREAVLARIREGLRTPAPPIEDKTFYGPIFEAVEAIRPERSESSKVVLLSAQGKKFEDLCAQLGAIAAERTALNQVA